MDSSVISAFIGASTGIVASLLTSFIQARIRKEEESLEHLQRQMEEFYGPIEGKLTTVTTMHELAMIRIPNDEGRIDYPNLSDEDKKLWNYFTERYFIPINAEIIKLLTTKSFLMDDVVMPQSFRDFMEHVHMFEVANQVTGATGVSSEFIKVRPFPPEFLKEIGETLNALRKRYNEQTKHLAGSQKRQLALRNRIL